MRNSARSERIIYEVDTGASVILLHNNATFIQCSSLFARGKLPCRSHASSSERIVACSRASYIPQHDPVEQIHGVEDTGRLT